MKSPSADEFAKLFSKALDKEQREMKNFNLMIIGKTGVGKSTLLNAVFGEVMTQTGIGKPVTQEIKKYTLPNNPLVIYDTPGLELNGDNGLGELLDQIMNTIYNQLKANDVNESIHAIWYCVNTASHRVEEGEIALLRELAQNKTVIGVPVIVVLTQSFSKKDARKMKEVIDEEELELQGIIPVLAQDYEFDENMIIKAYGLDSLVQRTLRIIPQAVRESLISMQVVDIDLKKERAQDVVKIAAAAAAAIGLMPIPFSDAALLIPTEIGMIAKITAIFGTELKESVITSIVTATIGSAGATLLGKTVVSGLLKLIPGVGTFIGGAISGAAAAAITASLGETFIAIMTKIAQKSIDVSDLDSEKGREFVTEMFEERMKAKRDKDGNPLDNDEEE